MIYDGYIYGMRLRGYSPGAQPEGMRGGRDDDTGRYHSIVWYDRELTMQERLHYGLDYLGRGNDTKRR